MITKEESYDLLLTALARLDNKNLTLSDDALSSEIFEELAIDATSFLHEWTVNRLIAADFITALLKDRILQLRQAILNTIDSKGTIDHYRNDPEWVRIRESALKLHNDITHSNLNAES